MSRYWITCMMTAPTVGKSREEEEHHQNCRRYVGCMPQLRGVRQPKYQTYYRQKLFHTLKRYSRRPLLASQRSTRYRQLEVPNTCLHSNSTRHHNLTSRYQSCVLRNQEQELHSTDSLSVCKLRTGRIIQLLISGTCTTVILFIALLVSLFRGKSNGSNDNYFFTTIRRKQLPRRHRCSERCEHDIQLFKYCYHL